MANKLQNRAAKMKSESMRGSMGPSAPTGATGLKSTTAEANVGKSRALVKKTHKGPYKGY